MTARSKQGSARMRKLIVTGLGSGYLPIAPGTWGSAAVAAIFLLVAWGCGGLWYCVGAAMLAVAAVASVACLALGRYAEAEFGTKDPRQCTIDEWAGQAVAYLFLPLGEGLGDYLLVAAAAFVAFRLFDIIKPPPAHLAERLGGGAGILIDDLVAGVYANVACQLVLRLWVGW